MQSDYSILQQIADTEFRQIEAREMAALQEAVTALATQKNTAERRLAAMESQLALAQQQLDATAASVAARRASLEQEFGRATARLQAETVERLARFRTEVAVALQDEARKLHPTI